MNKDELRQRLIRNFEEAELKVEERAPLYDGGRSARLLSPRQGITGRKIGCSVDIVPPGKRSCPYHFHYAQEEVFIVLEGEGTLRVAGEMVPIRRGDVISIPPGPDFPHQLVNTSSAPLKYLSLSTLEYPDVCEYPDSGKYMAYTSQDGPLLQRGRIHRADDALDYWDGEG
jgi:uncharacterized cupin superfamily protein